MSEDLLQIGFSKIRPDDEEPADDEPEVGWPSGDSNAEETAAPAASGAVPEPVPEQFVASGTDGMINLRNVSIKCGYCDTYQTLMKFSQNADGWNVYTYECENNTCDPERSRTHVEVPMELDEYAHRDPSWRGGAT